MADDRLTLEVDDAGPDPARRLAESLGTRVGLVGVLDRLDRSARPVRAAGGAAGGAGSSVLAWDRRDSWTRTWWPQGITCWADGAAVRSSLGLGERRVLLAAWYARAARAVGAGHTATRVSVLDLDVCPPRYAHVELVQPDVDGGHGAGVRPVRMHAGGLAWCGSLLLVADTRRGVRVFDLADVVRTKRPRGVTHLLPQRAAWRAGALDGSRPLRWSFLSLDRTEPTRLWLVAGEYARGGTGARLARWPLDPCTGAPTASSPVEVLHPGIRSMQGAVRVEGRYVVSASRGRRRRGDLWTSTTDGGWVRHLEVLPVGPEDLAYDPGTRLLWTQTEHPRRRAVLSLPLPI